MQVAPKVLRTALVWASALLFAGTLVIIYQRLEQRAMARQIVLRVGAQESPPWYAIRPDGTVDGPVFEIIRDAARRAGLRISWLVDNAGPQHALTQGIADIWPLMGRLPARMAKFQMTESWLDLSYLVVARDRCDTPSAAFHSPQVIAHRDTDVARSIVSSRFPRAATAPAASHVEALRALCDGRADSAIIAEFLQPFSTLNLAGRCAEPGICLKSVPASVIGFGIGSRPGSDAARAAAVMLREEIDHMIDDGTLAGIFLRWGVSSGEVRAMRAAQVAKARTNLLAWIVLGLALVLIALTFVYAKLLTASRERERINEELRASQNALQEEFARRMEAEEKYQQSQKMDSLGRMAGGVAHDFNNLLMVINGYSDLALAELSDHPARDPVEQVLKAGQRAADLTRQLLAFSRKQVVQAEPLNLNDIVQDTAAMLRRVIGEDVELVLALDPEPELVLADTGQVCQVLVNLCTNARDALSGSGRVVIETANVTLDAEDVAADAAIPAGRYVMLAVSDTGSGMTEDTRRRVFEPFFTTKPAGKGTGLGLATVYGIVRQAGGHITVDSELGKGTTFRLYLPAVAACPAPHSRTEVPAGASTGKETVLVVEDQPEVRKFMVQALEVRGYRVLAAADGEEALEISRQFSEEIHLLVTDVVMPRMDGRELSDQISAARPGIKILYTSGYTDNVILRKGILGAGMNFLAKPFPAEALSAKVRNTLDSPT